MAQEEIKQKLQKLREEEEKRLKPVRIIYKSSDEVVFAYYRTENGKKVYYEDKEGKCPIVNKEFEIYIPYPFELFGVECGEGWNKLIQPLFDYIENYNQDKAKDEQIKILQVKEKFGSLRFYTNFTTSELNKMEEDAEDKSYHTCEICGSTENIGHTIGWITTLCHNCVKENAIKNNNHKIWIRESNNKAYFVFPDKEDEETDLKQF